MMGIRLDITNDMSKQEEIKILDKLRDAFMENPDNYLASLFTNDFVGWCTNRIRDDFPLDAYEQIKPEWDDEWDKERTKLENEVSNLKDKLTNCERNYGVELEENDRLNKVVDEIKSDLYAAESERDMATVEKETCEQEIIKLKARLYDLMTDKL
jgi:hypothetical protein